MHNVNIRQLYHQLYDAIGGETNPDIHWYRYERPTHVSRETFFEPYVEAVWKSGLARQSADTFMARATAAGFAWDFARIAGCSSQDWSCFVGNLHGSPCPRRAHQKWSAIRSTASALAGCASESEFQQSFFAGKELSKDLQKQDIRSLAKRALPFVRRANAQFIIRNMGGEAIKCDRWVQAFLKYSGLSLVQLEQAVQRLQIPLGLFDVVLWVYCESKVKKVSSLASHLRLLLANERA